jgi:probable HAF family extracellular repeat protein
MKPILISIAAGIMLAALVTAQTPRYTVTDLGTLPGGKFSQATTITNNGFITGVSTAADGSQHAVLWYQGRIIDISKPGVLGPNSEAFAINLFGQAAVEAESTQKDPNNENFCLYGTGLKCLGFFWQGGVLTPLPTLGGNNSSVGVINNLGEVAGFAENGTRDPACPNEVSIAGTGPQVLDYDAVVWGPRQGQVRVLRPVPGDTVGMAFWLNDLGQAVGVTGTCANTVLPPIAFGPHAVIWERDGSVRDLGNLGSKAVNIAFSINNLGQVVGFSSLTDQSTPFDGTHAFLWSPETGKMRDLGTLPGDALSGGEGINDRGDVVGASYDHEGNPRPFFWRNGSMFDLNDLVPSNSPLFLLNAFFINSRGEIAGFGVTEGGDVHAFVATPANVDRGFERQSPEALDERPRTRVALSDNARKLVQQLGPAARFGVHPR